MSVQLLIRVDPELKEKITRLARYEKKTTSQMVREIIEDYVKERDVEDYIDELWERIGNKLKSKGIKRSDIPKAVREVRKAGE